MLSLGAPVPVFIYLNFFVKPGHRSPRDMSTWYILLILGAIMLSFNEEKFVKQQECSMWRVVKGGTKSQFPA